MSSLLTQKQKSLDNLNGLLDYNYKTEFKKSQTDQIEKQYKSLIADIEAEMRVKRDELESLRQQNDTQSFILNRMSSDLLHVTTSYQDCEESKDFVIFRSTLV